MHFTIHKCWKSSGQIFRNLYVNWLVYSSARNFGLVLDSFHSYPNVFIFPKKCLLKVKHLFCQAVYFLLHVLLVLETERARQIMKEQKGTRGILKGRKQDKMKTDKETIKGRVCDEQKSKSCLLNGKMASRVWWPWLSVACHCDNQQGDRENGSNRSYVAASQLVSV